MRFAQAFLGAPPAQDEEGAIARHLAHLLEAVVPGPPIPPACPHVAGSNLGFALPMNWALAEADRRDDIRAALRARLAAFEPRLSTIGEIEIAEDDEGNIVEFFIRAQRAGGARAPLEIGARVSLLDHGVEEGGA